MGDSSNIRKKNPTPTLSKSGWECGAGDRTRTGTPSLAADFESATSTISSHRQVCYYTVESCAQCASRVPVSGCGPRNFWLADAREISTAARRSGRFFRHRRRSPRSPDSHRYAIEGFGFCVRYVYFFLTPAGAHIV